MESTPSAAARHDELIAPEQSERLAALFEDYGAQVTLVDKLPYDGAADHETYRRIGAVFAEARRKREHFGQPPVHICIDAQEGVKPTVFLFLRQNDPA